MVAHWKEDSGRQPSTLLHQKTKEDLRPKLLSLMTLMFLLDLVLVDLWHLLDRSVRLDPHQDGLQLLDLLAREREKVRAGNPSRERLHPRSPSPEPQLVPIPMSDGDDAHPPQGERQRQRSRSRDRAHPHAQVPQVPQIQPVVIHEPHTVSDEASAVVNPSSPSPDCRRQLNSEVGPEENRDPDRVSEHLHMYHLMPASSLNLLHLLSESSRSVLRPFKVRMRNQQPWNHRVV